MCFVYNKVEIEKMCFFYHRQQIQVGMVCMVYMTGILYD